MVDARSWERWKWEVSIEWVQGFRWARQKTSRDGWVTAAHQCECTLCHRTVHLEMVKMLNFMSCIFHHKKKTYSHHLIRAQCMEKYSKQ